MPGKSSSGKAEGLSRRHFLLSGAATLGAVAAAGLPAFGRPPAQASAGNTQDNPKAKVLHIIGHSHIDAAWLWPWRDGANVDPNTFRSALDRMKESAEFRYSHSSAMHYSWVER